MNILKNLIFSITLFTLSKLLKVWQFNLRNIVLLINIIYIACECLHYFRNNMRNNKHSVFNLQVRKKIFYKVFKNYLIYIRNNVKHIYYFVSKKQKKYLLRYLKSIYYIFYKF